MAFKRVSGLDATQAVFEVYRCIRAMPCIWTVCILTVCIWTVQMDGVHM